LGRDLARVQADACADTVGRDHAAGRFDAARRAQLNVGRRFHAGGDDKVKWTGAGRDGRQFIWASMNAPAPDLSKLRIDRGVPPIRRRRRRRWIGLVVVALALAGGGGWWLLQPRVHAVQTTPIVTTYPSQQFVVLNATGYVVAQRKAAISSKATGRLEWLGVAEGSRVSAGDVIARIDNRDVVAQAQSVEATVRAARANVQQADVERQNAQVEYRRNQELVEKNFISRSALDNAKARVDRAGAAVASAQANLNAALANARNAQVSVDYTQIRAPFDGVILSKSANVGDLVTPFSSATDSKGAVVTMADMSTLEVEADVSESSLAKVRVGQPAEIVLDALPDSRFRGHISRMVPTVDRAKATVMTKVKFDEIDPRILPEMSAKVSFLSQDVTPEQQKPLLAVHPDALAQRDGKSIVFVVRDGKAVAVPVTPGISVGGMTAISGDVKSGDKVVLKPAASLQDGALVKTAAK
jgi:RND family efflux transporter MFP subunit